MFGFFKRKEQEQEDDEEYRVELPLPEELIPENGGHLCKVCYPLDNSASGYCARHRDEQEKWLWDQFNRGH